MVGSNAPHLLSLIGHELDAVEAKWTTIGALAVAYHGLVRASLDADALVSFKTAKVSADAFAALLGQQELQVEYREGEAGDPIGFVIRICDSRGNRVDLLGGMRKSDPEIFARSILDEPDGLPLRFTSVEDLIALKLFAGGPKDLEDAAGVLASNRDRLDRDLLTAISHRFGRTTENRCRKLLGN